MCGLRVWAACWAACVGLVCGLMGCVWAACVVCWCVEVGKAGKAVSYMKIWTARGLGSLLYLTSSIQVRAVLQHWCSFASFWEI
jgi:hypothetical protein